MTEGVAGIVYEEARRGIDRQQVVVEALRSRAGTLFAAASLVTAFLGGEGLRGNSHPDALAWLAIVAFVALFALVFVILWPWTFRFVLSPQILIEGHLDKDLPSLQIYLAQIWEKNYDLNRVRILQLHTVFRFACLALSVEVVAWLVSLGRG
jgi:hypothetical protein